MVKINKKVEYALIVLKHFNDKKDSNLITARQICDLYQTPFDTTSKVMQIMNNHNILKSCQGIKGGYELARPLTQINYLELAEIIEGRKIHKSCDEMNCSLIDSCNITGPIKKLNEYLVYFFQGLTLSELLTDELAAKNILLGNKGISNERRITKEN